MTEVQVIFEEAIENGWFGEMVTVVRRDGEIFDFVLPGEPVRPWEAVREEKLVDVMEELKKDLVQRSGNSRGVITVNGYIISKKTIITIVFFNGQEPLQFGCQSSLPELYRGKILSGLPRFVLSIPYLQKPWLKLQS